MESNQMQSKTEVGYGRVSIIPDYPVAIAGSAAKRISEGVMDPIYLTCIAFRQEKEAYLIYTMDLVGSYEEFTEPVRLQISKATGIERDHILLNGTHTHSSVSARDVENVGIARYREDFCAWAIEAAQMALEDLSPAEASFGSMQTQGMVWMRHYKMADGSFAGANYGSFKNSTIVGHAGEANGEMQLIRFHRGAYGKKDVVLMNFPAHGTINGSSIQLSADFPGPARDYVAEKTDTLVAYFIAGAGDQVPTSRIPEENFSRDYRVYGEEVGRLAVETLKQMVPAEGTDFRFLRRAVVCNSNKADLDRAEEAVEVSKIWKQVGGRGTKEGREAAKAHGFSSVYEVTAILNRMKFDETRTLELYALAIGNISMIFAPYEMFGASATQIKRDSPFDMTFIVSCSQNHAGYLPDEFGWFLRCYEAQITKVERGTAEKLVKEYVDMLEEIKRS
ncbi:MAG: hypothetical protein IKD31_04335 [Clostridia bacterium]|nr:hypothetical protein [Clostridia bacterium]